MDLGVAGSADKEVPPIPTRHHFHSAQKESKDHHARALRYRSPQRVKCPTIPPASPEVISSLITSLSAITQPADSHFESQPAASSFGLPSPSSSSIGSFGVDYGAYIRAEAEDTSLPPTSLDNLPASSPVIRTSKPTSGYSPLTGAKSPTAHSPSRDSGSGFRSFIHRSNSIPSRPSSIASETSKNDDTHSIGNLSIEPGVGGHTPELRHHRSHDSWGKKTSRGNKALMYMNSKERLRERELERKRLHRRAGSIGESVAAASSSMNHGGRPDPFLAETVISEEPGWHVDNSGVSGKANYGGPIPIPTRIPTRDSSLRRSRTQRKRLSARPSKCDGDSPVRDAISEAEEQAHEQEIPIVRQQPQHKRTGSESFLLGPDRFPLSHTSASKASQPTLDTTDINANFIYDEGAPFPSVAQRRSGDDGADRSSSRLSGHLHPGPKEVPKLKRSGSCLKRLSGQLSPRSESRTNFNPPSDSSQTQNNSPGGYERPASADSVNNAVESYLGSPRLSQKIRHPQTGRAISFSEVGDANGCAVFCCVGMGLTRYITAFYDELALTLKLRLITPDRPGVGDSEPYADGSTTPLSWPDDVYAICQNLKITKFSILAHSAGAIYALATALRMPQHIRGRIHLLAPWIPPSQMNVFGGSQTLPPTNAIPTSQKILRALPTPLLKAANSSFMTATSSSITSSLPKNPRRTKRKPNLHNKEGASTGFPNRHTNQAQDSENGASMLQKNDRDDSQQGDAGLVSPCMSEHMDQIPPVSGNAIKEYCAVAESVMATLADKERQMRYDTGLTHAIWELATTGANPAVDLLVCLERRHTIGFRYVDITRPVVIHHGSRDTRVPVDNVKWLGKTMRRCEVRVLEGEGHGLMASATVMGSVLMEISKEWEDWMRVTGADGRKDRERGRRGTIGCV